MIAGVLSLRSHRRQGSAMMMRWCRWRTCQRRSGPCQRWSSSSSSLFSSFGCAQHCYPSNSFASHAWLKPHCLFTQIFSSFRLPVSGNRKRAIFVLVLYSCWTAFTTEKISTLSFNKDTIYIYGRFITIPGCSDLFYYLHKICTIYIHINIWILRYRGYFYLMYKRTLFIVLCNVQLRSTLATQVAKHHPFYCCDSVYYSHVRFILIGLTA